MSELELAKQLLQRLSNETLRKVLKNAGKRGFVVQGFKDPSKAPKNTIAVAFAKRIGKRNLAYLFLQELSAFRNEIEEAEIAFEWIKGNRVLAEEQLQRKINAKQEHNPIVKDEINVDKFTGQINKLQLEIKMYKDRINHLQTICEDNARSIKKYNKQESQIRTLKMQNEEAIHKIEKLSKENAKYKINIENMGQEINKLKQELQKANELINKKNLELAECQSVLDSRPEILCFSVKKIEDALFPLKKISQISQITDVILESITWEKYAQIWIVESDFVNSERRKIRSCCKEKYKNVCNFKALIEKLGGQ